ncbi:MAG: hypothetical protein WCQ82_06045 [Bacteroidaceae bacterium]|nr:hypothetical protein [Bacteroidaceae bacterium]
MKTKKTTNENLVAKLKYQLNRYKSMKNGAACQTLSMKIQKLSVQ